MEIVERDIRMAKAVGGVKLLGDSRPMNQRKVFFGALGYEFRMQVRRRSVWVTFIVLGLFFTQFHRPWYLPLTTPAGEAIVYWTGEVQSILAVAVGVLLADRLSRDRRTRVDELLNTLPGSLSTRLVGKYLGSTLATLIPMFAVYTVGVGYIVYRWQDVQALPLALATFVAIVLPGVLFVGAFSIACPAILWVPLYQFLFIGYWFWGNLLPSFAGIPTLSDTILTPVGGYMCTGFFNPAGREGVCSPGIEGATAVQGVESILLLLGIAALVMFVLWGYMKCQQARQ
jgi:ABC-2 type transport system permease protein